MIASPFGGESVPWLRPFLSGPGTLALGAVAGGATFGAVLGWAGERLPTPTVWLTIAAVSIILLLRPIFSLLASPPSGAWMVPRRWRDLGRLRYAFLFGASLGIGFATRVTTGTIYLVALLSSASPNPGQASATFAAFGLCRAVPVVVTSRCIARHPGSPHKCVDWIGWSKPIPEVVGRIAVSFVLGVVLQGLAHSVISS